MFNDRTDEEKSDGEKRKKYIGVGILTIVNVLWVLSAELTRVSQLSSTHSLHSQFIFIDEHFNRPFFTVYLKSTLCSVYLLKYCFVQSVSYPISDNVDTANSEETKQVLYIR